MSDDKIEKRILLRAPRARVWQALADAEAFGQWFGVKLSGAPEFDYQWQSQASADPLSDQGELR